jgi:hypothetical protein
MKFHTPQWVSEDLGITTSALAHWRVQGVGPKFIKLGPGPKAPVRYPEDEYETFKRGLRAVSSTSETTR